MSESDQESLSYGWLKSRPRWLQFLNTPKWFLFFLCQYFFSQSIVINGVFPGSISTIEKRFGFSSLRTFLLACKSNMGVKIMAAVRAMTGFLISSFDIAATILTPLISYLGGSRKKPVFVGWGLFTMGVSFFILMLPHFISPLYERGVVSTNGSHATDEVFCMENRTNFGGKEECNEGRGGSKFYYFLFVLGMLLAGAGVSPMYSLGIPYMDENVKPKVSPMYVGIFVAAGTLGATVGLVLAAVFLSMFVELGVQTTLTPQDQDWVGNWWLGCTIFGAVCVFWSFWLLGFPKEFSLTRERREKSRKETGSEQIVHHDGDYTRLKDLPKATKLVFSRLPFVFITLGSCLEYFLVAATTAFLPKIIEKQFYLSPEYASLLFGVTTVPCALVGNLIGAYINKRLNSGMRGSARMCFIVAVFGLLASALLFIKCDTRDIAGVNKPYHVHSSMLPVQLSSACNHACSCTGARFEPVCAGELTYFSPCHAGCSKTGNDSKTSASYTDCACVLSTNSTHGEVTRGSCDIECGVMPILFLVVAALVTFLTFLNDTPVFTVTLRSIPARQRSYALGLQMDLIRLIGAIPGPTVMGILIDKTCILWDERCGGKGACLDNDHNGLALVLLGVLMTCKLITTMSFGLAWFFSCRPQAKEYNNTNAEDSLQQLG